MKSSFVSIKFRKSNSQDAVLNSVKNSTDTLEGHFVSGGGHLAGALRCIWPLIIGSGATVSQDQILNCRLFQWINCLFRSVWFYESSWEYSKMLTNDLYEYEMLITFDLTWKSQLLPWTYISVSNLKCQSSFSSHTVNWTVNAPKF